MSKPNQHVNYIMLGHRLHFNWPLIILLGWMTLIAFGAITKEDSNSCYPLYFNSQGEFQ